jgi:hypothetical protein
MKITMSLHSNLAFRNLQCGQFGQNNMHCTFDFCPRPARKNSNVPVLIS